MKRKVSCLKLKVSRFKLELSHFQLGVSCLKCVDAQRLVNRHRPIIENHQQAIAPKQIKQSAEADFSYETAI
ncbi:hypothetical protein CEN49_06595 [Fischerella thermalis CCMEE 5273]|nr:hypothetical protein CEN49_06595 [Fischerella thermalis CCMEE 5273]PMB14063.1 hypothetical protein CEN48_11730 [Fischerella thermalis CCMEE 5282]